MSGLPYEIVVLSSSPPPAAEAYAPSSPLNGIYRSSPRRVAMPAPPLLALSPPVSPLRKTAGASALSSRKAPIPPEAIRGFATVGSLVRSEHFAQRLDDDFSEIQQAHSRRGSLEDAEEVTAPKKKPRKRSAPTTAADGDAKPKPKPRARKPKADSAKPASDPELRLPPSKISPYFPNEGADAPIDAPNDPTEIAPKLTKSGKPRKPRAKKEKTEDGPADPKPRKPRVTKPKAAKAVGKAQREDAGIESAHFRKDAETGDDVQSGADQNPETTEATIWDVPDLPQPKKKRAPKQRPPDPVVESLDLDEAVSRRRDWTPPKDTTIASLFTDSVGKENKQVESDANGGEFTHLISNFAYAQSPSTRVTANIATSTTETAAVMKRRRVELIDLPANQSNSRQSSPEKGKAPKKKARTITDIATEQYQRHDVALDPSGVTSDFFQPRTTVTKVPLNDTATPNGDASPKKPPRKRSTSKDSEKAGKAKTKKAAKPKAIAEKLLSPGSALMRLSKQDVLFGTSSQLALEESPTLVRQIQQALKESEQDSISHLLEPPPHWPKLEKVVGRRGLWDASSRDVEGGVLEQMQDVYIPEFDRTQDFPLLMDGAADEPDGDDASNSFVDIDDIVPAPAVIISSDLPTPPLIESRESQSVPSAGTHAAERVMKDTDMVFEDIDDFDFLPPPSNQHVESQDSFVDIDYILPASAKLDILPPPKPRPPAAVPVTESSKKPRGRPPKPKTSIPAAAKEVHPKKKTPKATVHQKSASKTPTTPPKPSGRFVDIDEILDSDDEAMQALSPTPPRMQRLPDAEPLPLFSVSPTRKKTQKQASADPALHRIPSSHLEWVHLKSSVFAAITSHIRALPPTTDPSRPSWHERMLMFDPVVLEELTAYLNAQTRIRAWKRATKAQAKKSGGEMGEGETLAIEKELEAWMVREWCESLSVCCVFAERGRGGARKGFY